MQILWRGSGSLRAAEKGPCDSKVDRGFPQVCMAQCSTKVLLFFPYSILGNKHKQGYLESVMAKERNRKVRPREFLRQIQGGPERERVADMQPENWKLDYDKRQSRENRTGS